jgi:putative hydrolase of the HAD superfamily
VRRSEFDLRDQRDQHDLRPLLEDATDSGSSFDDNAHATTMTSIAAVLFDLDDTLLDRRASVERYLVDHAARAKLDAELATAYHARFWALDNNGHTSRADLFTQLGAEFPALGSSQLLLADFITNAFTACEWTEGADDLLTWCRGASLRLGVITNGSSGMQRAKLRALGLAERVDTILVSEEEGISKPASEIFHRAAQRLNVSPAQCMFVGDNPLADIDGARRAGMRDVWIRSGFAWPAELAVASHSITSLASIRELLSSEGSTQR